MSSLLTDSWFISEKAFIILLELFFFLLAFGYLILFILMNTESNGYTVKNIRTFATFAIKVVIENTI